LKLEKLKSSFQFITQFKIIVSLWLWSRSTSNTWLKRLQNAKSCKSLTFCEEHATTTSWSFTSHLKRLNTSSLLWKFVEAAIYSHTLENGESSEKMWRATYLDKLYLASITVTRSKSYIATSNWIIFCSLRREQ
jgi:hypothetical protein